MTKLAINGTGRIGLCSARIIAERDDVELVAINSTAPIDTLIHLLKHDSIHRPQIQVEKVGESALAIGKSRCVRVLSDREIANLDFGEASVVLECTGKFNSLEKASAHLKNSVKKVVISAPAEGAKMFVFGVNHKSYAGERVVSNASCTTNCLAPLILVLREFGIESGLMTTIHSYTNDQNVLDVRHKDLRRARAAALNMIPTSTGAAKAIGKIFEDLNGKLNGIAIRVPTPDVSCVDLSVRLQTPVNAEILNAAFERFALKSPEILAIDSEKLVSSDFIGDKHSAIFVPDQTIVIEKTHAKILAWYDNEVGYSARLVDLARFVGEND